MEPDTKRRKSAHNLNVDTVLVTGATAGIGKAVALAFADAGAGAIIITGRRLDRLRELESEIRSKWPSVLVHAAQLDIQNVQEITSLYQSLPTQFQNVSILVNNAGLALELKAADETPVEDMQTMVQTNVIGLMAMTSTFTAPMRKRGYGHVINIGSVTGHYTYAGGSVYAGTKFAVNAYTQALQQDLVGTPVRVTQIAPGAVNTEFSSVRFKGDQSKADAVYKGFEPLSGDDVADSVIYAATRPLHVQIGEIIIWPTNQAPGAIARDAPAATLPTPPAKM